MKIVVGSMNPVKIDAVKEIIKDYDFLAGAEVAGAPVSSEVLHQPLSLEETIRGAKNRARNSFADCDYGVGLESGIIQVPHTKTGYMDTTACAIFDGQEFAVGLSCCFEYPIKMTKMVLERNIEIDDAAYELGIANDNHIGETEGMIGWLTKGRMTRKDYTKQALKTALIQLENRELYNF